MPCHAMLLAHYRGQTQLTLKTNDTFRRRDASKWIDLQAHTY